MKRIERAKSHKIWTKLNSGNGNATVSDQSKFLLFGPDENATVHRRKAYHFLESYVLSTLKHSRYLLV